MDYEGFTAEVGYEDGDRLMHGNVINTRAVLHFAGGNIEELRQVFADTIADYRAWCKERGVEPENPSGALSFYRRVDEQAATSGESINQFIARHLEKAANLACVHANERPAWMRCIRVAIQGLHVDFASGRAMPSEGKVIRKLDEYAAAIDKVRELVEPGALAKPLEGIVLHAAMTASDFVRSALPTKVLLGAPCILDVLTETVAKAETVVKSSAVYRSAGRKRGAGGEIATDLFLFKLIFHTAKFGGKVRVSRATPTHPGKAKPYIGDIGDCLRPLLPTTFTKNLASAFEAAGHRANARTGNSPTALISVETGVNLCD